MVEIYPLKFSKSALRSASEEEQVFHCLLAQLTNEILILRKQVMLAANSITGPAPVRDAATAVAHLNLRLLGGRLYEGFRLLQSHQAGSVHKAYSEVLDVEALAARDAIFGYFKKSGSIVQVLRQKSAFHIDVHSTINAFRKMDPNEELTDYVCFERGNSLYYSGALLAAGQMAELVGCDDVGEALDRIYNEVTEVASHFEDYANGFMVAFMERHRGLTRELFSSIRQRLENCPDIQKATMPYFLDTQSVHDDIAIGDLSMP